MSFYLIDIAYVVPMPSQSQKGLLVRLAGYASNETGEGIYPAQETLAYELQVTERTIRHNLVGFTNCGLLSVVEQGGIKGPKHTTTYSLNIDMLLAAARFFIRFDGVKEELVVLETTSEELIELRSKAKIPKKLRQLIWGNSVPGYDPTPELSSGYPGTEGQLPRNSVPPNPKNPKNPISAGAREPCGKLASPASRKGSGPLPMMRVCAGDPQWKAWLEHLHDRDRDLWAAAMSNGYIEASQKWPGDEVVIYTQPKSEADPTITDRMIGEGR
ncbi:MAG: hypothetical protein AAGD43_06745 [Pseudomonadota bacterium]